MRLLSRNGLVFLELRDDKRPQDLLLAGTV